MTTVQFDKEQLQKQYTTRRDHDDDSSTMEAVEEIELGRGSYQIGDVLQESGAPQQQRLTPQLLSALAALDVNGDGIIDDAEIARAARLIQKGHMRTNFLKRLVALMGVCFLLASASTLGPRPASWASSGSSCPPVRWAASTFCPPSPPPGRCR